MISRVFTCIILIFSFVSVAYAATDVFTINTLVGSDSTPPSVPASFTADPVSISQINLDWASSTDNVAVTGYQVFRDSAQVATTTLTSYSDAGLSESTLYSYYVTAFDAASNVSASSSVIATTTLTTQVPATTTASTPVSNNRSGSVLFGIVSLEIIPASTSVTIRWVTRGFTKSVVRWGRTSSYEMGSSAEGTFSKSHQTVISGLRNDTVYKFGIEAENKFGIPGRLTARTFKTLLGNDVFPPANVRDVVATRDGSDVLLTWKNPVDADFDKVRIIRSSLFYPNDVFDGGFVYEGDSSRVRDLGAVVIGTTQYYTLFSYDKRGNISSGAVVAIQITDDDITVIDPTTDSSSDVIDISFDDILFEQDGEFLNTLGDVVEVDGSKQVTISIPYDKLPEHLKAVVVTVYQDDERIQKFSFLLRADQLKNTYSSILAPFAIDGRFPMTVSVFDFETEKIGSAHGELHSIVAFIPKNLQTPSEEKYFLLGFLKMVGYLPLFILTLVLLLVFAYRLIRRSRFF